eukprot:Phypoly_transcript_08746.p1 GENE.Phypoly_transcript_08746~~Phypoly_transcript_08746.p1  ORF type:complete len:254 (+),score=45.72 Phypoly_transcript_08746:50-763(+)
MEQFIKEYDLFLFDFDGTLADTESLHHKAYTKMCENRGFILDWDFDKYLSYSLSASTGVRDAIYAQFPAAKESDWTVAYNEKKAIFLQLLEKEQTPLLPGVERVIHFLRDAGKLDVSCVVTNSPKEVTELVRKINPILDMIPHWITREMYEKAKPEPDAYLKAIEILGKEGAKRAIGFEDSIRGVKAIRSAGARAVLISAMGQYGQDVDGDLQSILNETTTVKSFDELLPAPDNIQT